MVGCKEVIVFVTAEQVVEETLSFGDLQRVKAGIGIASFSQLVRSCIEFVESIHEPQGLPGEFPGFYCQRVGIRTVGYEGS